MYAASFHRFPRATAPPVSAARCLLCLRWHQAGQCEDSEAEPRAAAPWPSARPQLALPPSPLPPLRILQHTHARANESRQRSARHDSLVWLSVFLISILARFSHCCNSTHQHNMSCRLDTVLHLAAPPQLQYPLLLRLRHLTSTTRPN